MSRETPTDQEHLLKRIAELEDQLAAEQNAGTRRFRLAVEAAPNGIFMADRQGSIVLANQKARELFGYSETEMAGLQVEALMPHRYRHGHSALRKNYHHHPEQRPMGIGRDLFAQRKDGSEFPVEIGLTPVEIDGERLTLGMIADITERKKAEEALAEKAHILASLHEAVFTVGPDQNIETWNHGAELIFGWAEKDIVGQPVASLCPADDLRRYSERVLPALAAHGHYESTLHCVRRSGQRVTVAIRASLADPAAAGHPHPTLRVIICANDISRQKELESEIVQISEKEQRRIGQDLHDDLCQQLASIGCLAKVLRQQLPPDTKPETADALDLISDMLSSANVRAREISRGLAPAVIQREGLTSALEELASRTRKVFGVPCGFHCPDPVFIEDERNAVQLYRIAQEATANAVKHSDAAAIHIHLDLLPGQLRLRIADDGRGFPPETAAKSSGLGLLTMNYRAGILDGQLEIQSSPGRGTSITCTAPHHNE